MVVLHGYLAQLKKAKPFILFDLDRNWSAMKTKFGHIRETEWTTSKEDISGDITVADPSLTSSPQYPLCTIVDLLIDTFDWLYMYIIFNTMSVV